MENNYYLVNKKRILREINFALPHFKRFTTDKYGTELAETVAAETMERFEALLPGIPCIGGDENVLTENLYLSAAMLAFYQALKTRGKSVEETARLIYQGRQSFYGGFPFNLLLRWQGSRLFSRRRIEQRRRAAAFSQERHYPGDWVFEIVDSNDKNIRFGVDYTECGIVKYLTAQRVPELAPYLCWLDYPMCAAMRVGLIRTETLAQGNEKCNFRFCRWQGKEIVPDFMKN